MVKQKFVARKWNRCAVCLLLFYFCLSDCYLFSLPVVVSRVEIALVGVIVKCKRDDHVSNIYSFLPDLQIKRNY